MKPEERLLKYVSFNTQSSDDSTTCPSTMCQLDLANYLVEELKEVGLSGVQTDGTGYVYAYLPASEGCEDIEPIGFVAHMDTSPAAPGENIKPQIIEYQGGDIKLNDQYTITEKVFPFMPMYKGQHLMITDGTTLLGADDKAGIAEIITAMEYFLAHPEVKHGKLCVMFNPDEEVGRGMERVDLEKFGASYAYTVDGGRVGELEYECFNAATARVVIHGVNIHPGSGKNKMKSAVLYANEFMNMLPPAETPAHTEGYEGFFHIRNIQGNETEIKMMILIRDHDAKKFQDRLDYMNRVADYMNAKYGEGTVEPNIKVGYHNMREILEDKMYIVEKAEKAMKELGINPISVPIRGGTDGSALSFMGVPTPNISTGGENFHGVLEFISIESMAKMVEVIIKIAAAE